MRSSPPSPVDSLGCSPPPAFLGTLPCGFPQQSSPNLVSSLAFPLLVPPTPSVSSNPAITPQLRLEALIWPLPPTIIQSAALPLADS